MFGDPLRRSNFEPHRTSYSIVKDIPTGDIRIQIGNALLSAIRGCYTRTKTYVGLFGLEIWFNPTIFFSF